MSLRSCLGVSGVLGLLLVAACGKSGVDGNGQKDESEGSSCTTNVVAGDRACVPGLARAHVPIQLAVDVSHGCLACATTVAPCKVEMIGTKIFLSMMATSCPTPDEKDCATVCALPSTTCTLPPLDAGTYVIEVAGEQLTFVPRALVVTEDAQTTGCALEDAPYVPAVVDAAAYGKACLVDDDCTTITVGDFCADCVSCPGNAIAKSSLAAYEADVRERRSQCRPRATQAACGVCPTPVPICQKSANFATGTCVLPMRL